MNKSPCLCITSRNAKSLVNNFYTPHEASKILGLKFTTLLMLIKKKKIRADVEGKRVLISKEEIIRYSDENKIYLR